MTQETNEWQLQAQAVLSPELKKNYLKGFLTSEIYFYYNTLWSVRQPKILGTFELLVTLC